MDHHSLILQIRKQAIGQIHDNPTVTELVNAIIRI